MANKKENMNGSQFYITLRDDINYLDKKHTVFGQVTEGFEVLEKINEVVFEWILNVEFLQRKIQAIYRYSDSPHTHSV